MLDSGSYSTGVVGTLSGVVYACSSANGPQVSAFQARPWSFGASAYDAATGRTIGAMVSGFIAAFVVRRPGCEYVVVPPSLTVASFSYVNSTSVLTMNHGSLIARQVEGTGCNGIVREGDRMSYVGSYTASPAVTIVGS